MAQKIGNFALYSAIFIFIILLVRLLFQDILDEGFNFGRDIGKIISYLIICVALIVVAIPEGLPLAVTLTLAYSMKEMHREHILVRKLASCETMGAAHFLCTDKTGTLTQNKMKVMEISCDEFLTEKQFKAESINSKYLQTLLNAIYANSSAFTNPEKGAQTEIALLKLANRITGKDENEMRAVLEGEGYFLRIPFNSSRKRLTTGASINGENFIFSTGASERILDSCESLLSLRNGETKTLSNELRHNINKDLEKMASEGLRTVGICFKKSKLS